MCVFVCVGGGELCNVKRRKVQRKNFTAIDETTTSFVRQGSGILDHEAVLGLLHVRTGVGPGSRACDIVELLNVVTPDFIPPNLWPPNGPDINPADYKICNKNYTANIKNASELRRQRIAEEWEKPDQRVIELTKQSYSDEIDRACVEAGGGQFEHKM